VFVDFGPEPHLLELGLLLPLLGLLRVLGFFVLVPAKVEDSADRRTRGRRNLDQIEAVVFGDADGIACGMIPSWLPSAPMTRTCGKRMRLFDTERWLVPLNVFVLEGYGNIPPGFGCSGLLVQASPWLPSSLLRFP